MRVQANLKRIIINPRYQEIVDGWVKTAIENAAREWLRAALEKVPVWSGASRATFQALASAVNEHVEIDIKGTAPNRLGLGRLYSRGGVKQLDVGHWEFYYETTLRYLITNETQKVAPRTNGLRGSLIAPTPYEFREAGNRAAQAYIDSLPLPSLEITGDSI